MDGKSPFNAESGSAVEYLLTIRLINELTLRNTVFLQMSKRLEDGPSVYLSPHSQLVV